MTLIARYYENESQAREAHRDLLDMGLARDELSLIEPAFESEELESRAVRASVFLGDDDTDHAAQLRRGRYLVAVKAPFGRALQATHILDFHEPVAAAGPAGGTHHPHVFLSEMPAPLSKLLGLPVLSNTKPSRSGFLGLRTLAGNRSYLTGKLGSRDSSRGSSFGIPLLSANPAPLSSMTAMPLATRVRSGERWSRSFGLRMLSGHSTPFSSFFGIPLLSGHNDSRAYSPVEHRSRIAGKAAPFSGAIGLKPLSSQPLSFLSRILPPLSKSSFTLGAPGLGSNAAPLSSLVGMPVKSGTSGPKWRTSMGFPLLSGNPAPLSSRLGFALLSEHPRL